MFFPDPYHIALKAAVDASALIMEYYTGAVHTEIKSDGSPVTDADLASSALIHERLAKTDWPVMGEEIRNASYAERKNWKEFWCVDPLDGTKEFIRRNGEFAVNIALIDGGKPVFGIIASPVQSEIIFGGENTGVYFSSFEDYSSSDKWQELKKPVAIGKPLALISSRSHHDGISLDFINALKAEFGEVELLQKGSSLKFFDLALVQADIYPRFAPTMEWDIASGQAILEGLGGAVIHAVTGKPLVYNKENLLNAHFIAKTAPFLQKEETSANG